MNKSSEPRNGQRVYVWIIATSTLLLIGLFLWPLSVQEFRTTAVFKLKYEPESGVEKTMLNSWVVDALRIQTDRNAIAEILSQMDSTMTSSVLNSMEPETIRQAIHIQGRPGTATNSVEYRLSMVGEGSKDEIEFINMIIARINNQLDLQLTRNNSVDVVQKLTNDFEEFHDDRLRQVSGQITEVMSQLATVENEIKIVSSDLQNLTAGRSDATNYARPTEDLLQSLQAEKQRMLLQGYNEYHPEVMAIRQKIERLNMEPAQDTTPQDNSSFQVTTRGQSQFIKNQFVKASSSTSIALDSEPAAESLSAPIGQILNDIESIDLTSTRHALSGVQDTLDNLEGTEMMVARLNDRAIDQLDFQSPVTLADFKLARRSSPMGGSPSTTQFVCLFLLAGFFGTVVALNFDPALKKRPFRSVQQLQRKLSVPVIGVLRNRSAVPHRPINKLMAARVVQICEWTLLALAVLLILAALANSDVAAAFIENPFHGITETIWLISPKN